MIPLSHKKHQKKCKKGLFSPKNGKTDPKLREYITTEIIPRTIIADKAHLRRLFDSIFAEER
jgi:hypothetical protein